MSTCSSELGEEILADYLLGILPPEQARALEARLAQEPQLAAELQALQEALHLLPYGLPGVIPSASVRSQVMAEAGAPPIPPQPALPSLGLACLKKRWLRGLGAVALLLLAFDNWRLRQTPQPAPLEAGQALAQLLQQPGSRLVTLQGEAGSANLLFRPGEWQAVV
jgi:anti-sigma factor RsiW